MSYTSDALIDAQEREIEKLKAENAKLRMYLGDGCADCAIGMGEYADSLCDPIKAENERLREACKRLIQIVCVAESISDCWLLDSRLEGELRALGFEVSE